MSERNRPIECPSCGNTIRGRGPFHRHFRAAHPTERPPWELIEEDDEIHEEPTPPRPDPADAPCPIAPIPENVPTMEDEGRLHHLVSDLESALTWAKNLLARIRKDR